MKPKTAIVFFSAGLGDAVLLIPVAKRLKDQGYRVAGLFNSDMPCAEMMRKTGLLHDVIEVGNKAQQAVLSLQKMNSYDLAVVNMFAGGRANMMTALSIAKKVVTNAKHDTQNSKIETLTPLPGIHDGEQNLRLIGEKNFNLSDLRIDSLAPAASSYIALQVSSGNENIAYKNWPVDRWMQFLSMLLASFPGKQLVLLGTKSDIALGEQLKKEFGERIDVSQTGKTNISQAMGILSSCSLFIGLDGGLMHIAAAYGKPTFTLWGPSSEKLYGYQQFDPVMHRCVRSNETCFPCNAWIDANTSKAETPEKCPDHACMKQLDAKDVFIQFRNYVNSLPKDVW